MYELKSNKVGILIHANDVESSVLDQIKLIEAHPSIKGLVAIMPDVHAGAGCVIGFTGTFKHSIIPSIVGFDVGCGVDTYSLGITPLNLSSIYTHIEENIPFGFNSHKSRIRMNNQEFQIIKNCEELVSSLKLNVNPSLQAGTLGGGNHFIEIEKSSSSDNQYLTVHSGSRKFGLEVAKYYQKKAKELVKSMRISIPNDLEYLPLGEGQLGNDYLRDMYLAQSYASVNRKLMMKSILNFIGIQYKEEYLISSVHNYISKRDNIVRKGAISAHLNEPVVIPLNMGKNGGIILGTGLGNKDYNCSAPHGAGRVSGRNEMKRQLKQGSITMDQFQQEMEGIFTKSATPNTIDESPMAYKAYDTIKEYLMETVYIIDIARPILSFKDHTKH